MVSPNEIFASWAIARNRLTQQRGQLVRVTLGGELLEGGVKRVHRKIRAISYRNPYGA